MIKIVDIFAGPGGLSEGFASVTDHKGMPAFDIALSIEMDSFTFQTLKLRSFFRSFTETVPEEYYKFLRKEISLEDLYARFPEVAKSVEQKCWQKRLGSEEVPITEVRKKIDKVVGVNEHWALIGGPPCQAYSIAGRSSNVRNPNYDPNDDVRLRLYVEYLQVLADHQPPVFVMENVKGLLSASLNNEMMFKRILEDLKLPHKALRREGRNLRRRSHRGYRIYSLTEQNELHDSTVHGAVVQTEDYGIPQTRHRVILLGIRDDVPLLKHHLLLKKPQVSTEAVLSSLPHLRSGLSRIYDSSDNWMKLLQSQLESRWMNQGAQKVGGTELTKHLRNTLNRIRAPQWDRGTEFIQTSAVTDYASNWYNDNRIQGICNHSSRGHMEKDLFRYFYAAAYAELYGKSPTLREFPTDLLPAHENVTKALSEGSNFSDRFRVQLKNLPATTVVSHISKDGHYYIHYDPLQCRSLTVREAARLQTFPDNYFFCGPRTAQFIQVGNAVPPLLARQIGKIVLAIIEGEEHRDKNGR